MKLLKRISFFIVLTNLIVFGDSVAFSQSCLEGHIKFSNQQQIDSFLILNPNCVEIEGDVRIVSETGDIINLLGLSNIISIEGSFRIYDNPELIDLTGLGNLQSIDGFLYIGNNDILSDLTDLRNLKNIDRIVSINNNSSLESLAGLDSIEFELTDYLEIIGNSNLSFCSIPSICQHLFRYGQFQIYGNGEGCIYMEDIYSNCPYDPDTLAQYEVLCFEDGFESWNTSGDSLTPDSWTIGYPGLWLNDGEFNIERVPSLNEGDYAILLRSNGPGIEGPERTIIERQLCGFPSRVDIAFTYTCRGEGYCELRLGQSSDTSGGWNLRPIWNGHTHDTIKRTVVLNNIPVNPPFSVFQIIQFRTNPVYWSGGSYGISEFTIDSLVVREYNLSTRNEWLSDSLSPMVIYPNPSPDIFYIHSSRFESSSLIAVYTIDGQLLFRHHNKGKVDLNGFPAGVYLFVIQHNQGWNIIKAVKL